MKLLPYPQPRPHLRRSATSKGAPEQYYDHSTWVIRWMGRNGFRRVAEVHKATGTLPTVDELQSWLEDHCTKALDHFEHKYDKMTRAAALYVIECFDPEERAIRVKRGHHGGKMSGWKKGRRGKRPVVYTTDQLRKHEHLSIKEQAEKLGCSAATVKRRRADLKAEKAAAHEAELDAIFGPQEVAEPLSEAEEDDLLASLDDARVVRSIPETSETVSEMFNAVFAQYGLTREMIRAQTPDWTTPDSWTHEHEAVSA